MTCWGVGEGGSGCGSGEDCEDGEDGEGGEADLHHQAHLEERRCLPFLPP